MTTPGPNNLFEAAAELLAVAAASLADSPGGFITSQAITQGLPSFDCPPAIYVSAGGPAVGNTLPGVPSLAELQRITVTGEINIVTFTITVIRCVSTIEQGTRLPSDAEVTEDARICYGDLWAIWNGVKNAHRDKTLFQTASGRREFGLDPAVPVRTEGGAGGWLIQCRVALDGYAAA